MQQMATDLVKSQDQLGQKMDLMIQFLFAKNGMPVPPAANGAGGSGVGGSGAGGAGGSGVGGAGGGAPAGDSDEEVLVGVLGAMVLYRARQGALAAMLLTHSYTATIMFLLGAGGGSDLNRGDVVR
jgi:hypothetical protein